MKKKLFSWSMKDFQPLCTENPKTLMIVRKEPIYGDDQYLLFDSLTHSTKRVNGECVDKLRVELKDRLSYIENQFVHGATTGPLKTFIAPWGFCNLNCLGCYAGSGIHVTDKIPFELFTRVIDQLYELGNLLVVIGGGEPLIHDEIWRYIDYIRHKGMGVSLTTNGFRVDDTVIKYIKYFNVRLNISLDGTKEYHNEVRVDMSGSGTFDRVIESIKKYTENGIFPTLRYTLTERNLDDANGICDLANSLGLKLKVRRIKHGDPMLSRADDHALLIKDYKSQRYLDALYVFNKRGINLEDIMNAGQGVKDHLLVSEKDCGGGTRNVYINYKGDIYPCEFMGSNFLAGNIYDNPLDIVNIWRNSKQFIAMRSLPQYSGCATCKRELDCHTECPAIVLYHNKRLGPDLVDPACMVINGYFAFEQKKKKLEADTCTEELMFSRSWQWYDLFKSNKDYHGEIKYLEDIMSLLGVTFGSALELACGTSSHGAVLNDSFDRLVGIDINQYFIKGASAKNPKGKYRVADMRSFRLDEYFDVVLALYGALGYMQNSPDLYKTLLNISRHLKPSGVLFTEPWYTPSEWQSQVYKPRVVTKNDGEDSIISRMSLGYPDGTITFEYLACKKGDHKIQRFSDSFRFGLHKTETIIFFLQECGLHSIVLKPSVGPFQKRGLIISSKSEAIINEKAVLCC